MILYSIIPPEIVFNNYSGYDDPGKKGADIIEAVYRGEKVQVRRSGYGRYELVRLLSTCPEIFLKGNFQPGKIIDEMSLKQITEE